MNRFRKVILKNLLFIPSLLPKLSKYAKHPEKYSNKERMEPVKYICERIKKSGNISVEVSGKEHIPQEGGFIFYPNHQGLFDAIALLDAIEIPFSPVIKKELTSCPFLRRVFACMDAIPMDREDLRQSMGVMQEVGNRVAAGRACLIFPEGRINKEGNHLLEFKPGSFKPAVKTHSSVVPIALVDSFKPFGTNKRGHIKVHLHVIKPLLWDDYQGMTTIELANIVKEKIQSAMEIIISQNGLQNAGDFTIKEAM